MEPRINLIAALSLITRTIGKDGDLPWKLPGDMKRFKEITMGHPVIMGRKTWESIPSAFRPLPGRTNIVVTRDTSYSPGGAFVAHSIPDALEIAEGVAGAEEVFGIGGGEVYAALLQKARRLYLTLVLDEPKGDTFFPPYSEFRTLIEMMYGPKVKSGPSYFYLTLEQ